MALFQPSRPTTRRGRRRSGGLAALAGIAVVLAGCSSAAPEQSSAVRAPTVLPAGAYIAHPSPPTPSPSSCTASYPPPTVMPTAGQMPAGSFMAKIEARGYLTVGVTQNTYLWGYRDPVSGQLEGFDISMLDQVAQAIFGPTDLAAHIHYVIVSNADRIPAVQKGQVDILAETMTITCERKKDIDFSTVYYEAQQQILVPSNSSITGPADLAGKRVCAVESSTSLQNLVIPPVGAHPVIWAVPDITDCLVMLQQDQVDAISTDNAILKGLEAQDPNTKLVGGSFSEEPYGLAISKAHPDFTSFVDGVLRRSGPTGRGRRSTTTPSGST